MSTDLRSSLRCDSRQHRRCGRTEPQALRDDRGQVFQLLRGLNGNIFITLESLTDDFPQFRQFLWMLEQIVQSPRRPRGRRLATRRHQDFKRGIDLISRHAFLVIVSANIRHEIRPLGIIPFRQTRPHFLPRVPKQLLTFLRHAFWNQPRHKRLQ